MSEGCHLNALSQPEGIMIKEEAIGMVQKESLAKKTVPQLREIAKSYNIVGRWDLKKDELVNAILRAEKAKSSKKDAKYSSSAKDEGKIEAKADAGAKEEKNQQPYEFDREQRLKYVENVKIGTLVAFTLENGKTKAAKVTKKSSKRRQLKVETEYGATYNISYDSVIWVRTGRRWPSGVMKMLKSAKTV